MATDLEQIRNEILAFDSFLESHLTPQLNPIIERFQNSLHIPFEVETFDLEDIQSELQSANREYWYEDIDIDNPQHLQAVLEKFPKLAPVLKPPHHSLVSSLLLMAEVGQDIDAAHRFNEELHELVSVKELLHKFKTIESPELESLFLCSQKKPPLNLFFEFQGFTPCTPEEFEEALFEVLTPQGKSSGKGYI